MKEYFQSETPEVNEKIEKCALYLLKYELLKKKIAPSTKLIVMSVKQTKKYTQRSIEPLKYRITAVIPLSPYFINNSDEQYLVLNRF